MSSITQSLIWSKPHKHNLHMQLFTFMHNQAKPTTKTKTTTIALTNQLLTHLTMAIINFNNHNHNNNNNNHNNPEKSLTKAQEGRNNKKSS